MIDAQAVQATGPKGYGNESPLDKLVNFIYNEYGLVINMKRRSMLATRLQRHIQNIGLSSLDEYADLLINKGGMAKELTELLNASTTRTTSFFREIAHYEFIENNILKQYEQMYTDTPFSFRTWSAACSTGQEAYSLAMLLDDICQKRRLKMDYQIHASDISEKALTGITEAVYEDRDIEPIPESYKQRYLLQSKGQKFRKFRIVPSLREKVKIKVNNLSSPTYKDIPRNFDLIFLRNILIYFDRDGQNQILTNVIKHLKSDGYLLVGHSESITNYQDYNLVKVNPATFQLSKSAVQH